MNVLSNTVSDYYFSHFDDLSPDKQFHFVSRLYLYAREPRALPYISALKSYITHKDQPETAIEEIISASKSAVSHGSKNAAELRRPYFEKYPNLKVYVTVLFRITFLKTIYDIDCRDLFYKYFDKVEVQTLRTQLLDDKKALAILSTHAINFLYLYERVINENDVDLPIEEFIKVGQEQYDHHDNLHLQLLIYLYTHCIIGDAMFYFRSVPAQNAPHYQRMLVHLEDVIGKNFNDINLDNKFEFLVCTRILGGKSKLETQIFEEAERSISSDGNFLIDRHNNNPQTNNIELDTSEHRNVLFVMANQPFTPIKT